LNRTLSKPLDSTSGFMPSVADVLGRPVASTRAQTAYVVAATRLQTRNSELKWGVGNAPSQREIRRFSDDLRRRNVGTSLALSRRITRL
jgi:hypothetical protein